MSLAGRTALVTGAGRGIGAATARALAAAGARVVVAARRLTQAEAVAQPIRAAGGEALAAQCDVTDDASVAAAFAAARQAFGAVDILIVNAGVIAPIARLVEADPAAWMAAIDVNLVGAYRCLRAALPDMLTRGEGVVINLSSGAAHRPLEGWSAYCASKAGLAMLTRAAHEEYGAAGLRVIGVSPGVVDTDMQAAIRASGVNPVSKLARESLAGVGEPASAIAYLCGPGGAAYAGREVDIREAAFRAAAGLAPRG